MTRYFIGKDGGMPTPVPDDEPGDRAETLAHSAFYTEVQVVPLDAVVIRRDELPEVKTGRSSSGIYYRTNAGYGSALDPSGAVGDILALAEIRAREFIALAEYLREHPPVDEAQVDAIAEALGEAQQNRPFPQQLSDRELREEARLLFQQGVRVGGEPR